MLYLDFAIQYLSLITIFITINDYILVGVAGKKSKQDHLALVTEKTENIYTVQFLKPINEERSLISVKATQL